MWNDTDDPKVFGELMLKILRNKETVIRSIMTEMDKGERNLQGLIAQLMAQQQKTNKLLLMTALIYIQGAQFGSDAATLANKMGMGSEALRELFKQKFEGK